MEKKASNLRNKIAKLLSLSHGTSSIPTFLISPPLSPRKPTSTTKPFSTSIIPSQARRRPKNGIGSFDTREPASPKVSCLGQIINKKKPKPKPKPKRLCCSTSTQEVKVVKTRHTKYAKENIDEGPKDQADDSKGKIVVPSLGEMKRFTSGRGVLSKFQWIVPKKESNLRKK